MQELQYLLQNYKLHLQLKNCDFFLFLQRRTCAFVGEYVTTCLLFYACVNIMFSTLAVLYSGKIKIKRTINNPDSGPELRKIVSVEDTFCKMRRSQKRWLEQFLIWPTTH